MTSEKMINHKTLSQLEAEFPILTDLRAAKETSWINSGKRPFPEAAESCPLTMADILDASARLDRFADYFRTVFPETSATNGIIESPLRPLPAMQKLLESEFDCRLPGTLWLKQDSHLPISGSIKARGGIYEVLYTAERIALEHGLLTKDTPYRVFASEEFRSLFSQYAIAVGSTGNLGLSVGIMSAKLGFNVTVHMSADARQWKKDLLRSKGVTVIEYESDYSIAVANGRKQAENNPHCHFIDDENSKTLFLGYAVAALRLKKQLEAAHITVDEQHPLFVHLPCGVGGAPGGVAFGLKMVFGDAVHCFFAEPTQSCCMILGMATGLNNKISVQDIGLTNLTAADGLAVGRASGFVGPVMAPFISGCYTISDERMYRMLAQLADSEGIFLEPSALAGLYGPILTEKDPSFSAYLKQTAASASHITQLAWATGGSMVPSEDMEHYYQTGKKLF